MAQTQHITPAPRPVVLCKECNGYGVKSGRGNFDICPACEGFGTPKPKLKDKQQRIH